MGLQLPHLTGALGSEGRGCPPLPQHLLQWCPAQVFSPSNRRSLYLGAEEISGWKRRASARTTVDLGDFLPCAHFAPAQLEVPQHCPFHWEVERLGQKLRPPRPLLPPPLLLEASLEGI